MSVSWNAQIRPPWSWYVMQKILVFIDYKFANSDYNMRHCCGRWEKHDPEASCKGVLKRKTPRP